MAGRSGPVSRPKGTIETLPSGSLRVRVYAGINPLTKKRHYLEDTVPAGPKAGQEAERVRRRMISEVEERRHPRTRATLNTLLDRVFDETQTTLDIEESTRTSYLSMANRHIRPVIGELTIAKLAEPEVLDAFRAELNRCRDHCTNKKFIQHRTASPHECDARCRRHECKPLGASGIRQTFAVLSKAYGRAKRWKWISYNPIEDAELPSAPNAAPKPPTAAQMAAILTEAWKDPDWGMFVWLKARTGARRGEMCALRIDDLDLDGAVVSITKAIAKGKSNWVEQDTKTHQHRRVALDEDIDVPLLRAYLERARKRARELGVKELSADARLFSLDPAHVTWLNPGSVSQRFDRTVGRAGVDTTIKNMRHFSATELIAAGVDIRTVAGRLGHSGGGTTTLKVYAAFVAEADQRAATHTGARLPAPPEWVERLNGTEQKPVVPEDPTEPYEKIAADLAGAIRAGILPSGATLPSQKALAERYGVAPSTANRAVELLKRDGLVTASRGVPATVI